METSQPLMVKSLWHQLSFLQQYSYLDSMTTMIIEDEENFTYFARTNNIRLTQVCDTFQKAEQQMNQLVTLINRVLYEHESDTSPLNQINIYSSGFPITQQKIFNRVVVLNSAPNP